MNPVVKAATGQEANPTAIPATKPWDNSLHKLVSGASNATSQTQPTTPTDRLSDEPAKQAFANNPRTLVATVLKQSLSSSEPTPIIISGNADDPHNQTINPTPQQQDSRR